MCQLTTVLNDIKDLQPSGFAVHANSQSHTHTHLQTSIKSRRTLGLTAAPTSPSY